VKAFAELTEQEILALAISAEEEDARIYADYANGLKADFPASAQVFTDMAAEENDHRRRLIELHRQKFGEHIPLVRRHDVRGFARHEPLWIVRPLGLDRVRKHAEAMEFEARRFYERAMARTTDAGVRKLLGDLAEAERSHISLAQRLGTQHLTPSAQEAEEETRRRMFVLQIVQPGLAGLMDGSVSTLAPLFAAAFATHSSHDAFVVGLAASIGAGISMGFAEALSDDGALTGRGHPWVRGVVCGLMTAAGGLGHTLPFLVDHFGLAVALASLVVAAELAAISYIRHRYMDTPLLSATFQVVVGGVLVFLTGLLIGSA
jgi:erythrin-vacuolar iron transport family protein